MTLQAGYTIQKNTSGTEDVFFGFNFETEAPADLFTQGDTLVQWVKYDMLDESG